jgi:hypothetical protein
MHNARGASAPGAHARRIVESLRCGAMMAVSPLAAVGGRLP